MRQHAPPLAAALGCAESLAAGFLEGTLPWKLNDRARGLKGQLKVPKRDWSRTGISGSVSRHTQHTYMWQYVDGQAGALPRRGGRCLDWDGWYGGSIFKDLCGEVDVLVYATPFGRAPYQKRLPKGGHDGARAVRWWHADAHSMASVLPTDSFDLIIANSVFEHLERPYVAMEHVARLLRPGGVLFWHTPFQFEMHGVPHDYLRYTAAAARMVAEAAGLVVEYATADGGDAGVLSHVLGLSAKFWGRAELSGGVAAAGWPRHYLSTRMIASKPKLGNGGVRRRGIGGDDDDGGGGDGSDGGVSGDVGDDGEGGASGDGGGSGSAGQCAPVSSVDFAASVRRAWQLGQLPMRVEAPVNTTNAAVVGGSAVLPHLRQTFWRRLSGRRPSARRCLHWAPAAEARADAHTGGRALLRAMCVEVVTVSMLADASEAVRAERAYKDSRGGGGGRGGGVGSGGGGSSGSGGDYDLVLTSAAFSRARDPWRAMRDVAALLARRRGVLLWHEPFVRAEQGPSDLWRFTTSAARSLAVSAGLSVPVGGVRADGGYGAVLCDTFGLPPNATRLWSTDGLTRGATVDALKGFYVATILVASAPGDAASSAPSAAGDFVRLLSTTA